MHIESFALHKHSSLLLPNSNEEEECLLILTASFYDHNLRICQICSTVCSWYPLQLSLTYFSDAPIWGILLALISNVRHR
jgi:hypothetical protein